MLCGENLISAGMISMEWKQVGLTVICYLTQGVKNFVYLFVSLGSWKYEWIKRLGLKRMKILKTKTDVVIPVTSIKWEFNEVCTLPHQYPANVPSQKANKKTVLIRMGGFIFVGQVWGSFHFDHIRETRFIHPHYLILAVFIFVICISNIYICVCIPIKQI